MDSFPHHLPEISQKTEARPELLAFAKEAVDPQTKREIQTLHATTTFLRRITQKNPENPNQPTETIEVVSLSDRQLKPLMYLLHGIVTTLGDPAFERAGPYVDELQFNGKIGITLTPQNLGTLVSISIHDPIKGASIFSKWISFEEASKPQAIVRSALTHAFDAAKDMQNDPHAVARWIKKKQDEAKEV
ncbi:MAG: hypothetical protein ACD_28C00333G0004 [uncultured bacterium]|nr:MAG: hypothetical protein ACD_28C00333G0004 [uncultured bacterium]KKT76744.1 MAG: hypothetical protein UW70_C0014G0010 [Candidatus Peregrinibacteria bacterium GW2011_GWA2_44_7]